jgi:uncharacterized protein
MNSLDTNILVYAANADCAEHAAAKALVDEMLERPEEWLLADQVLFEFYKALRNPRIFEKPLDAKAAARQVTFLCEESGVMRCCYTLEHWDAVIESLRDPRTPFQRTHDIILAETLKSHGVTRLYTRNVRDFEQAGFDDLINPIDNSIQNS